MVRLESWMRLLNHEALLDEARHHDWIHWLRHMLVLFIYKNAPIAL
jgi:hypothetical protein